MDRQIDTVAGIELPLTARNYTFEIANHRDGIEVLLLRNGKPRRMALCTHQNDADTILEALQQFEGR